MNQNVITKDVEERWCRASESFGVEACIVIESQDATCTRKLPFHTMIERRSVSFEVAQSKWLDDNKLLKEVILYKKKPPNLLTSMCSFVYFVSSAWTIRQQN